VGCISDQTSDPGNTVFLYDWPQRFSGSVGNKLYEALSINVKDLFELILHIPGHKYLFEKLKKFGTNT